MPLQEKARMCKFVRRGVRKWEREREEGQERLEI